MFGQVGASVMEDQDRYKMELGPRGRICSIASSFQTHVAGACTRSSSTRCSSAWASVASIYLHWLVDVFNVRSLRAHARLVPNAWSE